MNFGGLEKEYTNPRKALFGVIPVPYDLTSTYVSGSRRGPQAILEASANMELFDEHLQQDTYLCGIHTDEFLAVDARGPKHMVGDVYRRTKKHLRANRIPVILGGEHSLSFGAMKAVREIYPELTVLHLDAHADLRDSYQRSPFSHACVARRMAEMSPLVQVGIRSFSTEEAQVIAADSRITTFLAEYVHTNPAWREEVVSLLYGNVYLTLDLDVFDPAIMPATGTPEPNGLSWRDVVGLLDAVTRKCRVVGFDVVELAPLPGIAAPDFLAAKLTYRIMGLISRKLLFSSPEQHTKPQGARIDDQQE